MTLNNWKTVGTNVRKVDGLALATGGSLFVNDLLDEDYLFGAILTSPHAHARIISIDTSAAEALDGVYTILHHENVQRVPHTTAGQGYPEPSPYDAVMFDNKVRYVGDRVAAVAASNEEIARKALSLIKVQYEVLEPVFDPLTAISEGAPVIHDQDDAKVIIPVFYDKSRNMPAKVETSVGNVDEGFAQADVIVEDVFETHYGHHCPIEPHVTYTKLDPHGRLIITTSTQVPFHVRRIVAQVCQIPVRKIRVIKPRIGGGFGGKQEILLEDVCSMLTLRTGMPVLLNYNREEEFVSSRTRHPSRCYTKVGVKNDGTITAIRLHVLLNTGAYGSHALTVGSNAGSKVLPMYPCENIDFKMEAAYTNLPVGGAYRGYGATQAVYGLEVLIDEAARRIGMDPVEFRKKNHIKSGQGSPIFKALGEGTEGVEMTIGSCGLDKCIELGAEAIGWGHKDPPSHPSKKRGKGCAILMQGSSIPHVDMGSATLKLNDDGSFNLLMGATDLGTGSDTILSQIAAEEIGVSIDMIIPLSSDTDVTPFDVGAYASSTTYLSGMAVKKTAALIRHQILETASEMLGSPVSALDIDDGVIKGGSREITLGDVGLHSLYGENQHQIIASASHITEKSPPPFAAHFVEVEVDEDTGSVEVLHYVAAVDCGTAIHPKLAEGQTEGAVANGLSYALTEQYFFNEKGRMLNPNFGHYKIFSSSDMPKMTTILVPTYEATGPYGAKSVSEISINGALPAIANAIQDAVGVRIASGPFSPDKVLAAMAKKS
ncbi:molybdopterin-dependent oxidoreductase [Myxococcota bacterium]|nr:molybdopterin-dependent oxidoreductase [Myxococcota bacterium]MBU1380982.1 molybdopterin-dependent oxidoreductase [Myxococcota bacterium]MBU1498819.1 molybdopterin-dependent oxidoreductase [Myxococcota bacterium]